MPPDITDDYVAQILKRDAERKDTNRFVANGLGSLLSNTRPRNRDAPKPNTRFLKHLVRDVDSHNAALLKKEAEEGRARLRRLKENGKDRRRSRSPRRDRKDNNRREREVYSARRAHDKRSRTCGESRDESDRKRSGRERESSRRDGQKRSRKERDSPSREPREREDTASESDPLDDIVGPKPLSKSRARGRGAHKDSNMDARFDAKYDPRDDVGLDDHEEDDDWDLALEAMRDRAKWRKSGAERLRAAGFTEGEVDKWEKGGKKSQDGEGEIESVRWKQKGEGREWDRGKVVEGEHVELKPEWGRLKDT